MISNGPVLAGPRMIRHIESLLTLLDLHQPNEFDLCMSCDRLWPCPTIMIVTGAPATDGDAPVAESDGASSQSVPVLPSSPPVPAPHAHPSGPLPTTSRPGGHSSSPTAAQGPSTGAYPVSATAGNPTGWIPSSAASLSTGAHRIPAPPAPQAGTPAPPAAERFPAAQPPPQPPLPPQSPAAQPPPQPPLPPQSPAVPWPPTAAQPPSPGSRPMPPAPRQHPTGPIQPLGHEQRTPPRQPAPWNGGEPSGQPHHGAAIPTARPAPLISGPIGIPPSRTPAQPVPADPGIPAGNGMPRRSTLPATDRSAPGPQPHHPRYPHPAAPRAEVTHPGTPQQPGTQPPQPGSTRQPQARPSQAPHPEPPPSGADNRDGNRWPEYGSILDGIDVI